MRKRLRTFHETDEREQKRSQLLRDEGRGQLAQILWAQMKGEDAVMQV